MIWHNASAQDVLNELGVDKQKGLPKGLVDERKAQFGDNIFGIINNKSFLNCLLSQFKNMYIIVFIIVALIYALLTFTGNIANWWEPIMLFTVIVSTAIFAAFYQYKALYTLNRLNDTSVSTCEVLRDGIRTKIKSSELVPGDILIIEAGNYIPADGRIIDSVELRCDESPLTGETVPVEKNHNLLFEDITPVPSRANMVYAGCSVIHGWAHIVVTQTGAETEMGKKEVILKDIGEDETPIMQRLSVIGKVFSIICLIICAVYLFLSVLLNLGKEFLPLVFSNLLTALSLIISAIPETLCAVGTIILALGIRRMTTSNIIPRKANCIETLGGISVICTDKTGILTENELCTSKIYANGILSDITEEKPDEHGELLLKLALMCSQPADLGNTQTNKIDEAIFNAGVKYLNMDKTTCDNLYPRLSGIPFDSERKLMSTVNMIDGKPIVIVKGAAEIVLKHCLNNTQDYQKIINELSNDAYHVIGIAVKQLNEIPAHPDAYLFEENLSIAGLIAMTDPLQGDALEYIDICEKSGIRTVVLTGDHINTAIAVAKKMGIFKDGMCAISGEEIEKMSDEELFANIEKYCVFARVTTLDKKRIVDAWKKTGQSVAVTGFDASDAAVLQSADIGCAMGKSCTDVAKGVSDIIISDGRFSGLVRSILRCRGVFDNIRKCVHYLIACNSGELLSALFGVFIFKTSPIAGIHFLTVNMLTDCGPAIALGMQPTDTSTKHQAPQKRYGTLLNNRMTIQSILQSFVLAVVTLVAFGIGKSTGVGVTMAFATLTLSQMAIALNLSSDDYIIKGAFLKNKFLLGSIIIAIFFTLLVVLTPICGILSMKALRFINLLEVFLFVFIITCVGELYKFIRNRLEKN